MDEFWTFIINALFFFIAFKAGQISVLTKTGQKERTVMQIKSEEIRQTGQRPIIIVEKINGIYYAFDGNDFLAQGNTPDEIGKLIVQRFPDKYVSAKVEMKA